MACVGVCVCVGGWVCGGGGCGCGCGCGWVCGCGCVGGWVGVMGGISYRVFHPSSVPSTSNTPVCSSCFVTVRMCVCK
jgi:hypothetical protein